MKGVGTFDLALVPVASAVPRPSKLQLPFPAFSGAVAYPTSPLRQGCVGEHLVFIWSPLTLLFYSTLSSYRHLSSSEFGANRKATFTSEKYLPDSFRQGRGANRRSRYHPHGRGSPSAWTQHSRVQWRTHWIRWQLAVSAAACVSTGNAAYILACDTAAVGR